MPLQKSDLLGTWTLIRTRETVDGVDTGREPIGVGATGVIHYLPDDRMAVIMANGGRQPMSRGRYDSDDCETAESARTFTAYAGTFEVDGNDVIHHLDLCLHQDHVGTDYLRHATLDGDRLVLAMPEARSRKGMIQWSLEWRRASRFAPVE